MTILKDLQKYVKIHYLLALLGLVVLFFIVAQYSTRKGLVFDSMRNNRNMGNNTLKQNNSDNVKPAQPDGQNEVFESVKNSSTSANMPSNYANQISNPEDLLPKDTNSQWAALNPRGSGTLDNVNLLQAGWQAGINTVGSSLRNANLQIRSEPINSQTSVSPWMNSTIQPDLMRTPLELHCGAT